MAARPPLTPKITRPATPWNAASAGCKRNRAVATRYDKLAVRYEATVHVAAINEWLLPLMKHALAAVRQIAEELTVRPSMIFLDGREFSGEPPGLRTVQRGPLMLVYLTDVRGERVVIIQVNWIG